MQLDNGKRASALRSRLSAAACMLMAAGAPAAAQAQAAPAAASTQLDISTLLYGEKDRANVAEPIARVTRLFANGQSLSAQVGIDVITGASPTGALPSGALQTVTTPSGKTVQLSANQIPTKSFKDIRRSFDADWTVPVGLVSATVGGHYSREKDYESFGENAKVAIDLFHHRTTLTGGAGRNQDTVFPVGGTPVGLSDGSQPLGTGRNDKHVTTALAGVTQVLTRRWLMSVNGSRTLERGFLTEPYKVISLKDPVTNAAVSQLTDNRPSSRDRDNVVVNSVYHLKKDVLYLSYRYYWDDWKVKSNTYDLRYRDDLGEGTFLEPHLRYYAQSAADFFRFSLINGKPLPRYATSDMRLGKLQSMTAGVTLGFQPVGSRGEWTIRAEYIRQHLSDQPQVVRAGGGEEDGPGLTDMFPALNIGSLVIGYSINF